MIEVLGQSPINSIVTAGRSEFMSIFRNKVSNAFSKDSGRYPRAYTSVRGILINKELVNKIDSFAGYYFQFNPQTINDAKETLYETRGYVGLPYNDYIWGGGGERVISFQLFLDNTPQSKINTFRPASYGSKEANVISGSHNGFTYDDKKGLRLSSNTEGRLGQRVLDEVKNAYSNIAESALPSKGPLEFSYEGNAFSNSRVDERGILPEVEKIQSFLYPAPLNNEATPLFASGGVVSSEQFRPPATVILAVGPLYFEGVIKSAPVQYTLFDKDLTPIRGTIDIEFAVFEFENIKRELNWTASK